jgi:hypothetical protein
VQNDDDDGRGSATTLGEEVWASADTPANGEKWGHLEQPVQLLRPHAPQRARPEHLARRWVPNSTTPPR